MIEDLSEFFDTDELADRADTGATSIAGIFSQEYVDALGVESFHPVFLAQTAEVKDLAHGHSLEINQKRYKIAGKQPDGFGLTNLILEEQ